MKYFLIKTAALVYQDFLQYTETERSLGYLKTIKTGDFAAALHTLKDDLAFDLNFDDYVFLLKSYYGGIRTPSHFIRFSMVSNGFCIKEEAKELILAHNLPKYELYKLKCAFRKSIYSYYWFRIHTEPVQQWIDFEKSKFSRNEGSTELPLDYEQAKQTFYDYRTMGHNIEALYLKKEIEQFDFFFLAHYPHHYFVSERLKLAMEKAKFKGMEFEEANWLKITE